MPMHTQGEQLHAGNHSQSPQPDYQEAYTVAPHAYRREVAPRW
jgi:hypothetical protein